MSFRKRLLVSLLVALFVAALDVFCAPFVVAHGLRWWVQWVARQEGLNAAMDKVDAPFWRPATIHHLQLSSAPGSSRKVELRINTLRLDLNFRGWIFSRETALLRTLEIDHISSRIEFAPRPAGIKKLDWRQLPRVVPENFEIGQGDLEIVTATTAVGFRGVTITASAIESGKFLAHELTITSPILRQTFRELRGATSWENKRLTIAGIPLVRGLDLEALTLDLSRLRKQRVGLDLQLDAYGGTLRASFQGRAGEKFSIDLAGSAANISLAQISRAIGFLEPVSGAVHASKFTFRGNPGEFLDATASVWMELTDFAWRARRADNVMLGATYYDRRLEVDQLYVRQSQNALTINGEMLWPKRRPNWLQLPFRGSINATIPDLNSFAQLFGATTGDFTGALLAEGNLDSLAPEAHGRLTLRGQGVAYRGVAVDSLGASVQLKGSEMTLENLEARHGEDFLRGGGSFDLAAGHRFAGRLAGAINDLGVYAPLLPRAWRASTIGGGATFDWRGDGTLAAHSGTLQFFAHGLQLPVVPLRRPLDVTLEGSYSPRDVFFRTFQVANERVSLGGFLMLGNNFIELQAMQFALDGQARANGTLFLPMSVDRWRKTGSLLEALDEKQKFDLDLAVDHLDLASLASALGEETPASGLLSGKLAAFGPLTSLQITSDWHLSQIGKNAPENAFDFDGGYAAGQAQANASATFGVSSPVRMSASLPLRLEKKRLADGAVFDQDAPFSVWIDSPALFLASLPNEWRFCAESGLLSGTIVFSETLRAPAIKGKAALFNLDLKPPAPWPELSDLCAAIDFGKSAALIDSLGEAADVPFNLKARLTSGGRDFRLVLWPRADEFELVDLPSAGGGISALRFLETETPGEQPRLREAVWRGEFGSSSGSLTIQAVAPVTELPFQTTFFLGPGSEPAEPLILRVHTKKPSLTLEPPAFPRFSLGELSDRQSRSLSRPGHRE